ncbi:MAG: SDR family NAD(P)-dependent oxidoreductase [Alphaproteobacteria bacterium]|nr:SDR family NAD(P)-dependent oxidoreductase [Alphaproteobacteria bacterium]
MTAPRKIWLITGVSSGFGRYLADSVIQTGDFVVGTMRKQAQIDEFNRFYAGRGVALRMDVTHPVEIEDGIRRVLKEHGRIDVLVNNAGYGLFGAVEEVSTKEARDQMETNFFGALAATQTVLPAMRRQRSGCIVQISSVAGFRSSPGLGIYNASKFALEGFSEALAQEVAPLGIRVLIVQPGPFRTQWAGASAKTAAKRLEDYGSTAHAWMEQIKGYSGTQPGDPEKGAKLIIRAVNAEAPPLRLPLGKTAIDRIREKIRRMEEEMEQWEDASVNTAFEE